MKNKASIKKVGILLSGCGFLDGTEIQEAVLTLLALDRAGAEALCFAPDMMQHHVVNHLTGKVAPGESRNVLVESARIARSAIADLRTLDVEALDALILPGGYGVAKNLSTYAFRGAFCDINADVAAAIHAFYKAGKPLGFICIAPVIAASLLGSEQIELTIGNDPGSAADINAMGARHVECPVWNTVVSKQGKIVSTPAYMLGPTIGEVAKGIEKLVSEVMGMC